MADVLVAPVHLDLLGALVDTSPIRLTITAISGPGLVLGNAVTALTDLLNVPPKNGKLDLAFLADRLRALNDQLDAAIPGITAPPVTPITPTGNQVLDVIVPPLDVNLLGLLLKTSTIEVNAAAQQGDGKLLGNLLTYLLNTLDATPESLGAVNTQLNRLLAKVVAVLNASTLTLPPGAIAALSQVLQTLALPDLVNSSGSATAEVLNLVIATPDASPPVTVDLLGLVVTTSDIQAQLFAQTGDGLVLGNLVYNVSHLLDPGGALGLLPILTTLGL